MNCTLCCKEVNDEKSLIRHCMKKGDVEHSHLIFNDLNKDEWVQCAVCGLRRKTLRDHVLVHNMTVEQYRQKYGEIMSNKYLCDIRSSGAKAALTVDNRVYRHKCKYCDNIIDGKALICDSCKVVRTDKDKELQESKFCRLVEGDDFIRCKVCGWPDTRISKHILNEHGMNKHQYRTRFGDNVSLICKSVTDKTAFRGTHSIETRRQMSVSHMG
jgi:predicted transcriptional regulator